MFMGEPTCFMTPGPPPPQQQHSGPHALQGAHIGGGGYCGALSSKEGRGTSHGGGDGGSKGLPNLGWGMAALLVTGMGAMGYGLGDGSPVGDRDGGYGLWAGGWQPCW